MKKIILSASLLLSSLVANDISVENAYVKQTPPHATNSAIFLTLKNSSDKDITLVEARTNLSEITELHTHIHQNGKMAMIKIPKIEIKANSSTELAPGGYHIMLLNLKNPIDANSKANLTLIFDNNQSLEIKNIPSQAIKMHHKK